MGRRTTPYAAQTRIEAWARSRERCVVEAVTALVESFADVTGRPATSSQEVAFGPGSDEDLLIDVLDEVMYLLETAGQLPVTAEVTRAGPRRAGLRVRFWTTDAELADRVGEVPKAIALQSLRFGPDHRGWSCAVMLDL